MMNIDELPSEILMKIFSYLRLYGDVSLVSRRFYDVACRVHESNACVTFASVFEENENRQSMMDSVLNTTRKISKLSIRLGYEINRRKSAISDVATIVKKFSATIKHFELRKARMEMSDFLEMLLRLPNAEDLAFTCIRDNQSSTDRHLSNECLNLHYLKTLALNECNQEFVVVFNRLRAGVLKKLVMINRILNWGILAGLLKQQSNIKELFLTGAAEGTLPDDIFDHLKLESLIFRLSEYNNRHAAILSRQTTLTHLRLREGQADDQILNVITNRLSDLETLHIRVNETQVVPFKRIEKLKKLKDLTLQTGSLKIIETLAELDNSRITTLNMVSVNLIDFMQANVISTLAKSLPNLQVLRIDYFCKHQTVVAILQHFHFLEVLEIQLAFRIDTNGLSQAIEVARCFNPKLTELKIDKFPCVESLLTKLAAAYPNLKTLDIRSTTALSSNTLSLFKAILTVFKKVESLSLRFAEWPFSTEYVECIKDNKNNLRSLTLSAHSDYKFTAEHKQKLSAVFGVTKYQGGALHLAD